MPCHTIDDHNNNHMYQHNKLQESANPISDSNGTLPYSSPHIPNEDGSFGYQKSIPEEDSTDYLKSKLWWMGISLMVIGEIGNFVGKWIIKNVVTSSQFSQTTLVSLRICTSVYYSTLGDDHPCFQCNISPPFVERAIPIS